MQFCSLPTVPAHGGRRLAPAALLVLALMLPWPRAAHAGVPVEAGTARAGARRVGIVLVHRRVGMRVYTSNGDLSPADRAEHAANRLRQYIDAGHRAAGIAVGQEGRRWTVTAGGAVLAYATRAEAHAQGTTPAALAARWARQLRHLVSLPLVSLSATRLVVPVGATRRLQVGGVADDLTGASVPSGAEMADAALQGRTLVVRGLSAGRAQVAVSAGGATARCTVLVRKYAGSLTCAVPAEVTGQPAPAALQAGAAALAIERYLPREPGARVELLRSPAARGALQPGASTVLTARVRIAGGDYIPVSGTARVEVRNRPLPERECEHLFYSNDPERIQRTGTLFTGAIHGDGPVRLFYHHINNLRSPVALSVTLVNPTDEPISLQIVPGFGVPEADAVMAGHRAGQAFFRRYLHNMGEIYSLPARSSIPLAVHRLAPEQTVGGIAQVRLLSPATSRCTLRVSADSWQGAPWPRVAAGHLDAWRHVLPRAATQAECAAATSVDVFPTTTRQMSAEYTIGQPWTWVRLGQEPNTNAGGARRLDGNYGVVYQIRVTIQNPTSERRDFEVAFEAGAGPASGVFSIAGRYVEAPSTYPREERRLAKFAIGPNARRTIDIETVPLGGSSYPAALIIR